METGRSEQPVEVFIRTRASFITGGDAHIIQGHAIETMALKIRQVALSALIHHTSLAGTPQQRTEMFTLHRAQIVLSATNHLMENPEIRIPQIRIPTI